ncbi:MAG: hypothetical protein EXS15_07400 [Phycisphaerales bacterium]|nr:hypothetical protein [Phycisphaerales bacterium]
MTKLTTCIASCFIAAAAFITSCNTAPSVQDRQSFIREAADSRALFIKETPGLDKQLAESAGYAVFPGIGKWGVIFGGSEFGRAVVYTPAGEQEGWASTSNPSVGLQLGGQEM